MWNIVNQSLRNRFLSEKTNFFARHQQCDEQHDFTTDATMRGFEPSMLCCIDPDDVPFAVRHGAVIYVVLSCFALEWFYRVLLSGVRGKIKVTFSKDIVS